MFATSLVLLALAATGFAQEKPQGSRTVYLTSMVDPQYVIVPVSAEAGSGLVVQTLANTPEQQWTLQTGTTLIQLAGTTLCMDGGPESNWADMSLINLAECDETSVSQTFNVMDDGRIALEASTSPQECIDLQFMRAVPDNPVGFYDCAGLGGIGAADAGLNWPLIDAEVAP